MSIFGPGPINIELKLSTSCQIQGEEGWGRMGRGTEGEGGDDGDPGSEWPRRRG